MAGHGRLRPGRLRAAAAGLAGVVVERWLFFAEARDVVMTYYRSQ